ncbi:transmembrane protein 74 [Cololabis saira]|uniref:transmembrane protein 74 n=1 Tax=Cololabis saira TaxID=129043 RepID=UPI002AD417FB|nr:transmembrane protein 74 [Cololabis saira]
METPELFLRSEDDSQELFQLSEDELSSGSVDYGFILAVACLVTGISLVAVTYTVPRDPGPGLDLDAVTAREMERLERERARVGAHLDRCVIAGLCLLTLGGALLSTLLTASLWKSRAMRRKALAWTAGRYGSISLRSSSTLESCSQLSADEDLEALG